jgi:hypothetical protein
MVAVIFPVVTVSIVTVVVSTIVVVIMIVVPARSRVIVPVIVA